MDRARSVAGVGLASLLAFASAHGQPPKVSQSLHRVFGRAASIDTIRIEEQLVYRIGSPAGPVGFAQVLEVRGKEQPITVLVAVDSVGVIRDIDILIYREAYGGEVAYEAWRKQFRGKGRDASFQVGRDIRGISGATISVHAVTLGIRKAASDFARWHDQGRLR